MIPATHATRPARHDGSPMPIPVSKAILSEFYKPLLAFDIAVSMGVIVEADLDEEDDHIISLLFGFELESIIRIYNWLSPVSK